MAVAAATSAAAGAPACAAAAETHQRESVRTHATDALVAHDRKDTWRAPDALLFWDARLDRESRPRNGRCRVHEGRGHEALRVGRNRTETGSRFGQTPRESRCRRQRPNAARVHARRALVGRRQPRRSSTAVRAGTERRELRRLLPAALVRSVLRSALRLRRARRPRRSRPRTRGVAASRRLRGGRGSGRLATRQAHVALVR